MIQTIIVKSCICYLVDMYFSIVVVRTADIIGILHEMDTSNGVENWVPPTELNNWRPTYNYWWSYSHIYHSTGICQKNRIQSIRTHNNLIQSIACALIYQYIVSIPTNAFKFITVIHNTHLQTHKQTNKQTSDMFWPQ